LEEVHEGICEDHLGVRPLVGKIIMAGYFWPRCRKKWRNSLGNVIEVWERPMNSRGEDEDHSFTMAICIMGNW